VNGRRRITDPVEQLAQRVAERVVDLVLQVVDVNALLAQVDVNALLERVDVAALLERVDLNAVLARVDTDALLDRIDVNDLVQRVDVDALVKHTDLGAVIASSTGGVASEVLDAGRSQAVGLDQFIDRWVQRTLRRKQPAPASPRALLNGEAASETPSLSTSPLRGPGGGTPLDGEGARTPGPPAPPSGAPPARPSEEPEREAMN
jgi:hypothetical protein